MFNGILHYIFLCTVFLVFLILISYLYCFYCFTHWKRKGVPYSPPKFPGGNITDSLLGRISIFTSVENIYKEFKDKGCRHFGLYFLNGPVYSPIDPEIVKSILLTDFDHFVNRGVHLDEKNYLLSGHIFSLKGEEWRNLRKKMTPIFTSGKMRGSYGAFMQQTQRMVETLHKIAETGEEVNMRTITLNYTVDIISSAGFGFDSKAQENPENELSKALLKAFEPNWWFYFQMVVFEGLQNPGSLIRPMHSNKSVEKFFKNLVKKLLKMQEDCDGLRKNFFSVLTEIRDGVGLSFNKLVAQCFIFYVAGFEPTSQVISFIVHELAHNQVIQDKLRKEIHENLGKDLKQFSYDGVLKIPYLDKVFKESLRLYPIMGTLHRICVKPYTIPGTDIILEKGTPVVISTLGIQRDPEFYPDPLTFNPDRFSEDRVQVPFTYLPFGEGPRFCLGMRFGILEVKIAIAALILQYKFLPSPKTPKLIEFDRLSMTPNLSLKDGVIVKISKM